MHRIFFDKRYIAVCSVFDNHLNDPNAVIYSPGSMLELQKIPFLFERSVGIPKLYIPSEDEELTYKKICSTFKQVNAGGGLVVNRRGDYLLIFRNGLWDLPKGKQEPGEDIRVSAMREVEEECGITDLELGELICITDHTYRFNGELTLKHTYWYKMIYNNPCELTPQSEESIDKAAWVAKSSLPKFLNNTYPSITEVFRKGHII